MINKYKTQTNNSYFNLLWSCINVVKPVQAYPNKTANIIEILHSNTLPTSTS